MTAATRRSALDAALASPLTPLLASLAAASPALLRLVSEHEAASRACDAESDRLEALPGRQDQREVDRLVTLLGRCRAEIALFPAVALPDVLLKVQAFALTSDIPGDFAVLREEIERRGGTAFGEDVALALALDLVRLGGFKTCA